MLLKIICLIFTINIISFSDSVSISELNETSAILSISSQLTELRAELDRQGNLLNESIKNGNLYSSKSYGSNCAEATVNSKPSGIYEILIPSYSKYPFKVACDAVTQGGGWTVILSRMDGSEHFYRNWIAYKRGFGNLDGEFFLGLDKIHALTADKSQELIVILEDFDGVERYELYDRFGISDEKEQYLLSTLGKGIGTAGDSLSYHHGMNFSTFDRDYNPYTEGNCAVRGMGAWWYGACHHSNLAGTYGVNIFGQGVTWNTFRGHSYSYKRALMMIRPRK